MPLRNWNDDGEFLLDLSEAMRPDPAEQRVIAAARAVYAWRTSDADRELAALLYDSCLDRTATVRAPVSGAPRSLVFGLGELRVEIELSDANIEGQIFPPEPGVVRLLTVAGLAAETIADEVGCFTFTAPPRGPIRIECVVSERRLVTEWINV